MQVRIPLDLRLPPQGVFRLSKQIPSSGAEPAWETLVQTSAIGAGTYLADLEPGHYQKELEATTGPLLASSLFTITEDGKYIDEAGKIFSIAQDGTLLEPNAQQEAS